MTDLLQPVDLVANGPLKARTKAARALQIYEYFQEFKVDYAVDSSTPYKPPTPTVASFINLISNIFSDHFTSEDFQDGVRRCFVSVGLAPFNAEGAYYKYTSHEAAQSFVKNFAGHMLSRTNELPAIELLTDIDIVDVDDDDDDGFVDNGESDVLSMAPIVGDSSDDYDGLEAVPTAGKVAGKVVVDVSDSSSPDMDE